MSRKWWAFLAGAALFVVQGTSMASVEAPPKDGFSKETQECVKCHKTKSLGIVQQWGTSKHYGANVGCYECHKADASDPDAFLHEERKIGEGKHISIIVSPKDCSNCHQKETREYSESHHSQGGLIIGSLDNLLADVVEGNRAMRTESFPHGVSAAVVNGCWQCHGSKVKVLKDEDGDVVGLDPATWPNTGIGRINPDGSKGSCSACHSRHRFSVAQARNPENCGKCHMGPDHPQEEIYVESKHGVAFRANKDKMNMDSPKWIAGEDYNAAPTCATCHMSATKELAVSHDVGMRISWTNRPAVSIRPEKTDAKLNLPGQHVQWNERRDNMKSVCRSCHSPEYVENFYVQYDNLVTLYNNKFAKPGLELYKLAKPLFKRKSKFANEIDFIWFEIWHHEGRRARHGASMMGPDWTHWHGTYEVAKHFYGKYIPKLEELIEANIDSDDPAKREAATKLEATLEEVLSDEFVVKDEITGEQIKSTGHLWFTGRMSPEEAEERRKQREEFEKRYRH
jgi:formate-dependent nitrite reductase cytochrome c552 subunit